ncbi:chymotrypsin-2-like [Tetranychus urticae]|nr:chymotrypsin-2-like [Tetranychus urticae]XP_025016486.1 chymotrypsin-2-like [Tetranychus urticae]XP_025016489.1 chymotrypsin-2-like [Tetranychus urticae]XP_025016494.1 chymotrypsin-2-like [Tetranychus urticae]XP_025016497.1 chymotrypsin-2-like [Tetranychus urticae]XP_025016498.1 chymotrypsin-2-like [Tetranychus urticae]
MINIVILMIILYSNFVSTTEVENTTETEYHEKIAYGRYVYEPGAYPFYYSIQYPILSPTEGYVHVCSGALLGKRLMITAAHCLVNTSHIPLYRVLPNYRNTPLILPNDLVFKIEDYEIHPGANQGIFPFKDDIAIVRLDQDDPRPGVNLLKPIIPLHRCLPVKMMGYGYTESGDYPYRLKDATVFLLSDEECLDVLPYPIYIPISNICVSNSIGSAGCSGDSGGPLVLENPQNGKSYLYGVLTGGPDPCRQSDMTTYVNVLVYLYWIDAAMLRLSRDELRSDSD